MRAFRVAFILFFVAGCSRSTTGGTPSVSSSAPSTPSVGREDAGSVSAIAARADAGAVPCKPHADCTLSQFTVDGTTVSLHATKDDSDSDASDDAFQQCQEQDVLADDPHGKRMLLARACPSLDRPLSIEVKNGEVAIDFDGQGSPSNWTGVTHATFTLSPPRIASTSETYFNRLEGCDNDARDWDFRTMRGDDEWSASCSDKEACTKRKFAVIPHVAKDDAFVRGWRDLSLGTCGTTFDSSHAIVTGKPTASIKAIAFDEDLFLEITDDKLVTTGSQRDRLEVWASSDVDGYMRHCLGQPIAPPTKLDVEWSIPDAGGAVRAHVALPKDKTEGLAIAYFDVDDGKTIAGTISTGTLKGEKPRELGAPLDLKSYGNCRVESMRLDWAPHEASRDDALWKP